MVVHIIALFVLNSANMKCRMLHVAFSGNEIRSPSYKHQETQLSYF